MKKIFFVLSLFSFSCIAQEMTNISKNIVVIGYQEKRLPDTLMKVWQHKDIIVDNIPGVSSEKAYKHILSNRKDGDTIIVAVIDSGVDIDHEDLKNQIWINSKEIPNNGKDDDQNGYIDDIHGWNFLGNKGGENNHYARWEYVRILKNKGILDKSGLKISSQEKDSIILQAAKFYKEAKNVLKEDKSYVSEQKLEYKNINEKLKDYFPNQEYSMEKLMTIDTIKHPHLKVPVKKLYDFLRYDLTQEWLDYYEKSNDIIENYKLNHAYNDRKIVGDDVSDINDKSYGNNDVKGDIKIESHGTIVSGLIGASRGNNIGIDGIADKVKLMILRTVPEGDEYDKDIALAIRYAVDNGAKVINMSFGKFFSPQKHLVTKAIEYASKNDVLIVHAVGNDSENIDQYNFYPLDYVNNTEISKTFINVAALNYKLNRKLPAYYSNYGKTNVDVFAPGHDLYTTSVNNTYILERGTSVAAPVVSGVAAIIRSQYPELKAAQVKKILMDSGNSYTMQVTIPGKKKSPKVPFSELSKSGKVVNVYNALLMAEQISKSKN
ncbi:S8 family peptidase [Aquimarina algiphila]|uniref:S8 family peptidase n=1 Tax=Aquimarina algiphila TaxID=2047982 RepID=UPI00248F9C26|nr:S8 family peptidase [Aquimarina algiphila]